MRSLYNFITYIERFFRNALNSYQNFLEFCYIKALKQKHIMMQLFYFDCSGINKEVFSFIFVQVNNPH